MKNKQARKRRKSNVNPLLAMVRQRTTPEQLLWLNGLTPDEAETLVEALKYYGIKSWQGKGWEGYRDNLEEARKFYPDKGAAIVSTAGKSKEQIKQEFKQSLRKAGILKEK